MTDELLTTAEVARLLGVKPETVYAYVSRGLLTSVKKPGARGSRFAPAEVARLAERGNRPPTHGLVISSKVTLIEGGHYWYRGRDAVELATTHPFERVADWLWGSDTSATAWEPPSDPPIAEPLVAVAAHPSPFTRIQAMVLSLSASDRLSAPVRPAAVVATGRETIATIAHQLGAPTAKPSSIAGQVAAGLGSTPAAPAVDQALGLIADHGLAASTTAVRVAAGFGATVHQSLLAGLATLSGTFHGGASLAAERLLRDAVDESVESAVRSRLGHRRLPGIGQPLYQEGDPRYRAIRTGLETDRPSAPLLAALEELEEMCAKRGWGLPNVDLGLGALTVAHDLAAGAGEAIFAIGRMAGWVAHAAEALDAEPIRPRARYTGARP